MKKRLIIFIPSIEEGGVEKNLFLVSNYLESRKIMVEILTCNHDKLGKFKKGIKFIGTKNSFWQKRSRIVKYLTCSIILFFKLFNKKDKILVFAFQANIFATVIARIFKTKIITRSNSAPVGWSKNSFKNVLYRFLISLADDVMVNSIEFKKSFQNQFNIKPTCIYNPFDKSFIKKKLKKKKI